MTKISKFAVKMRQWRRANNIRQTEAAEKAGIQPEIWAKVESGNLLPDIEIALKISLAIELA